jgi:RNA polymerase sigma-70 factor (ECF subfamily)
MEEIRFCLTDEVLVSRFAEGDNGAFEVLLMRHKDRVYAYILNLVHDDSVADDIFQETFIKVITTLKQGRYYDAGNKFVGWLMRIAHNKTMDYYRNLAAEKTISNDDYADIDLLNNVDLCDTSSQEVMDREEVFCGVEQLIDTLPEDQRRIVKMRYYQDLSFKEIADLESISINTALGRMRYALINLRKNADRLQIIM